MPTPWQKRSAQPSRFGRTPPLASSSRTPAPGEERGGGSAPRHRFEAQRGTHNRCGGRLDGLEDASRRRRREGNARRETELIHAEDQPERYQSRPFVFCSGQPNPTFEVSSPRVRQRNRRQLSTQTERDGAQLRERSGQQDIVAAVNQRSGEEGRVRAFARRREHLCAGQRRALHAVDQFLNGSNARTNAAQR